MVSIRRKILYKGDIVQEQLIRVLQSYEDRISALESAEPSPEPTPSPEPEPVLRDLSFTINDGTDPIKGATVTIGSKTGTTGDVGGCTIKDVAEGSVSVEVSKEGYTTKTETLTVDSTHTSFTISLTASSP